MSEYRPGACNIGPEQRRKRRFAGAVGVVAAAAYVGWILLSGRPPESLLGVFPLLFAGFLGLLQDYFRFCVAFGALARYDLSGSGGDAGRIGDDEAVRRDRRRAVRILAAAAVIAAAATGAIYGGASLL
ncbi:hypothetical protein [Halomicrobium salinisoli]|uniref:hypothetical protein n=1 Tax=Halomicrobium salinisoli TaxID=2878391 RepID=UPI001CF032D7|nr:hypothetical protein [Halomicrobium salinisoli]